MLINKGVRVTLQMYYYLTRSKCLKFVIRKMLFALIIIPILIEQKPRTIMCI